MISKSIISYNFKKHKNTQGQKKIEVTRQTTWF